MALVFNMMLRSGKYWLLVSWKYLKRFLSDGADIIL